MEGDVQGYKHYQNVVLKAVVVNFAQIEVKLLAKVTHVNISMYTDQA